MKPLNIIKIKLYASDRIDIPHFAEDPAYCGTTSFTGEGFPAYCGTQSRQRRGEPFKRCLTLPLLQQFLQFRYQITLYTPRLNLR